MKIKILDSKISNINSVKNMIEWIGYEAQVVEDLKKIDCNDRIIIPGIGNFGSAMKYLKEKGLADQIKEVALIKKNPILGICLGMQIFMNESEESPGEKGLELIDGDVKKFEINDQNFKVPHVGWNTFKGHKNHTIFNKLDYDRHRYYFVHSYFVKCKDSSNILASTDYGIKFT